jgi:RimJ/RimL family protein N-acetyltransferase
MSDTDLTTERLSLHLLTVAEGRRIVDTTPDGQDNWAEDFPMQDDRDGIKGFLGAAEAGADAGPFGCYRIDRDGAAIGTIGFYGPPNEDGEVMFGYGLVPGARGLGYATEAVAGLVEFCKSHADVRTMLADTNTDNLPSQRVLDKTGFTLVKEEDGLYFYTLDATGA